MFLSLLSLMLALSPPDTTAALIPPEAPCEAVLRFDLSLPPASLREICISPGVMTGILFDTPAVVEIQDEARFQEVLRGQRGVSFVPPRDLASGERLRLKAELRTGEVRQRIIFTLVAHPAEATHQVDVYWDKRTWQDLHDEANQAWLKNRRLHEQNTSLQTELDKTRVRIEQLSGLRGAFLNGLLHEEGVTCEFAMNWLLDSSSHELHTDEVRKCWTQTAMSVAVKLTNLGSEPWKMTGASLMNAQGEIRKSVRIWQEAAIAPGLTGTVFVEFEKNVNETHRFTALVFKDADTTVATLSKLTFR